MTHGIISARDRGQVSLGNTIRIKEFLQTDAAINPGSSGGPLVDLNGEVIGINTAIASHNGSNSGVAFSIPINLVKRIMNQLLTQGTVQRGYLGMQLANTFEPNDALKLGLDRVQGALVEKVYPETPAATAGLKTERRHPESGGHPDSKREPPDQPDQRTAHWPARPTGSMAARATHDVASDGRGLVEGPSALSVEPVISLSGGV